MPTLSVAVLTDYAHRLFVALRVPEDEAVIISRSLIDSNLAGHDSHGIIRVTQYAWALSEGILKSGVSLKILSQTPAVMACDGQWGMGQVQAHRLLDLLIPMARTLGIASGTLKHCGHIGRVGEYGEKASAAGLAFLATVNNHGFGRAVAAPGGTKGVIGTNPICLSVPAGDGPPVVLDIGTSVCAEGKVRVCFNKSAQAPEGWLLDSKGQPTTDPGVLYNEPKGTILPLGGTQAYKGFGLGLLLDMFAGGLSGSPCSRPELGSRSANAVFFALFDPGHFAGVEHFRTEIVDLIGNVRGSPPASPGGTIQLPGDPERRERERRLREGITLDDGTWGQLSELAQRLGVAVPG